MAPESPKVEESEGNPTPRPGGTRGRPPLKARRLPGPIKKHKCAWDGCNKSFSRKSDLNRHTSIHTNTRNHHCNYPGCGKSFIQTSALTVHKRTHTGEKPHECPLCQKAFADSSSLSRHRRTHRPDENPFKCTTGGCSDAFPDQFELDRHTEMRHGHDRAQEWAAPTKRTDRHSSQEQTSGLKEEQLVATANSNHHGHHPYIDLGVLSPSSSGRRSNGRNNLDTTMSTLAVRSPPTNPYARSVAAEDGYFSSQPATPTLPFPEWQQWHQPGDQRSYSGRVWGNMPRPHLPEPLPNLGLGSHIDAGPMSAPAYPTHHYQHFNFLQSNDRPAYSNEYRGQGSMPASTPVNTSECLQPPITSVHQCHQGPSSEGPLPSIAPYGTAYEQRLGSRPVSQEHLPDNAVVGRTGVEFHEHAEVLRIDMLGSSQEPETDMFSQIAPHYEEPRDMGSVSAAQHYRLPSMSFDLSLQDDDKVMTDFGEPLPSQVL